MALPNFTPEERAKALEKAAQVRKARKELKENIKSGKTDPASVLKTRKDDPLVSKMKVKEFLQPFPALAARRRIRLCTTWTSQAIVVLADLVFVRRKLCLNILVRACR